MQGLWASVPADSVAVATATVTAAVALSVGLSITAAVGGAVGGVAGGGGTAGGGMMPLIFGAQRFSMAGDMACQQSNLTKGVSGSMAWSTGSLSLVSSNSGVRRRLRYRLLAEDDGSEGAVDALPAPLWKMYDQLLTFGIGFSLVCVVNVLGFCYWKYRANSRYYDAVMLRDRALEARGASDHKRLTKLAFSRSATRGNLVANEQLEPRLPPPALPTSQGPPAIYQGQRAHHTLSSLPAGWPPTLSAYVTRAGGTATRVSPKAAVIYDIETMIDHVMAKDAEDDEEVDMVEVPPFKPYPSMLVFPALPLLVCWIFSAGLVKSGTALLMYQVQVRAPNEPTCGWGCTQLAVAVLLVILIVMITALAMLIHFSRNFRKACWKPTATPINHLDVSDPLFRLYSRVRMRLGPIVCCSHTPKQCRPLQRMKGKWAKPKEDLEEPARTERLLARPLGIFGLRAADCHDSMSLQLFAKASGGSFLGLSYAYIGLLIQCSVGVLSGMGPFLDVNGWSAGAQVATIAGIKLAWCAVILVCHPCACGLSNVVVALQFFSEGFSALILLLVSFLASDGSVLASNSQQLTFFLLIGAVFYVRQELDSTTMPAGNGTLQHSSNPRARFPLA